jgi:hypothetical protein
VFAAKKKGAKLVRSQSGVVPVTGEIEEARVINRLPPPAPAKKSEEGMIVPE